MKPSIRLGVASLLLAATAATQAQLRPKSIDIDHTQSTIAWIDNDLVVSPHVTANFHLTEKHHRGEMFARLTVNGRTRVAKGIITLAMKNAADQAQRANTRRFQIRIPQRETVGLATVEVTAGASVFSSGRLIGKGMTKTLVFPVPKKEEENSSRRGFDNDTMRELNPTESFGAIDAEEAIEAALSVGRFSTTSSEVFFDATIILKGVARRSWVEMETRGRKIKAYGSGSLNGARTYTAPSIRFDISALGDGLHKITAPEFDVAAYWSVHGDETDFYKHAAEVASQVGADEGEPEAAMAGGSVDGGIDEGWGGGIDADNNSVSLSCDGCTSGQSIFRGSDEKVEFTLTATFTSGTQFHWQALPTVEEAKNAFNIVVSGEGADVEWTEGDAVVVSSATDSNRAQSVSKKYTFKAKSSAKPSTANIRYYTNVRNYPQVEGASFHFKIDDQMPGSIEYVPEQLTAGDKMMRLIVSLDQPVTDGRSVRVVGKFDSENNGLSFKDDIDTLTFTSDDLQVFQVKYSGTSSPGKLLGSIDLSIHEDDVAKYEAATETVPVYAPVPKSACVVETAGSECLHSDQLIVSDKQEVSAVAKETFGVKEHHALGLTIPGKDDLKTTIIFTCLASSGSCEQPHDTIPDEFAGSADAINEHWGFGIRCSNVPLITVDEIGAGETHTIEVGNKVSGSHLRAFGCTANSSAPFTIRAITTRSAAPSSP